MAKITPRQVQALRKFGLEEKYFPKSKTGASLLLTYIIEGTRTDGANKDERIAIYRRLVDDWVGTRVERIGGVQGKVVGLVARSQVGVRFSRQIHDDLEKEAIAICPFKLLVAWDDSKKKGGVTTTVVSLVKKVDGIPQ